MKTIITWPQYILSWRILKYNIVIDIALYSINTHWKTLILYIDNISTLIKYTQHKLTCRVNFKFIPYEV